MANNDISVKCFYCFTEFNLSDVHFRARSPVKSKINADNILNALKGKEGTSDTNLMIGGNKKGGEIQSSSKESTYVVDEKLKKYYTMFMDLDEKNAEDNAKNFKSFTRHDPGIKVNWSFDEKKELKFVESITLDEDYYESTNMVINEYLCPHCHNKLPKGFGVDDTVIISLIGDTFSGKTVFLTVMLHELWEKNIPFESSLESMTDKKVMNEYINKYEEMIYKRARLPEATPVQRVQPPLVYKYMYRYYKNDGSVAKKSMNIVFYDIAGELCRDPVQLEKMGYYVKNSDGIIFLLNPLAIDKVRDFYMLHRMAEDNTDLSSQREIITTIAQSFLLNKREKIDIPVAITLSKADIFSYENVKLNFFNQYPASKLIINKNQKLSDCTLYHNGFLNKAEINDINEDVRNFLRFYGAEPFVTSIDNTFKDTACLAVSALNQIPSKEGGSYVLEKELQPYKVTEPFFWILSKKGFLDERMPSQTTKNPKPKKEKKSLWKWR